MPAPRPFVFDDEEVFAPTEKGNRHLKSGESGLSSLELQILVLVDGIHSAGEIAKRIPEAPREAVAAAFAKLAAQKLIVSLKALGSDVDASGFSIIAVPPGFFSLGADAEDEADSGIAQLRSEGFYVSFARRRAAPPEKKPGWRPTVLLVDDDADLQKLFRIYLSLEGFHIRSAFNREQIVQGLAQQPRPDLVLLDVQLPDVNGFDVLAKMRLHPLFKSIPVIMLTAQATREAVLKGLRGGADGYITKPFEPDTLVAAIKAVLGLGAPAEQK